MKKILLAIFIVISFTFTQEYILFNEWNVDKNMPMEKIIPSYSSSAEAEEVEEETKRYWKKKLYVDKGGNGYPYYIRVAAWTKKTGLRPHFLDLWYNIICNILIFNNLHRGFRRNPYYYLYPSRNPQIPDDTLADYIMKFHCYMDEQAVELRDGDYIEWYWSNSPYSRTVRVASGHMGYEPNTAGFELDVLAAYSKARYNPDKYVR